MRLRNPRQLRLHNLNIRRIRHHPKVLPRANPPKPLNRHLNLRPPTPQNVYKLFRVLWSAQRPETATYATSHNNYVVVSHLFLYCYYLLLISLKTSHTSASSCSEHPQYKPSPNAPPPASSPETRAAYHPASYASRFLHPLPHANLSNIHPPPFPPPKTPPPACNQQAFGVRGDMLFKVFK